MVRPLTKEIGALTSSYVTATLLFFLRILERSYLLLLLHMLLLRLLLPFLTSVVLQVAYLAVMQNVSSSNRSGYNALRKVYRESAEGEERLHVLGVLAFNHVKLADIFGCSESIFLKIICRHIVFLPR
jgi:puromycin-sensitive aminopeptidase